MQLTEQDWNKLPPELREQLAREQRPHYGVFFTDEWYEGLDIEVIEDRVFASVVFRWLVGGDNLSIPLTKEE